MNNKELKQRAINAAAAAEKYAKLWHDLRSSLENNLLDRLEWRYEGVWHSHELGGLRHTGYVGDTLLFEILDRKSSDPGPLPVLLTSSLMEAPAKACNVHTAKVVALTHWREWVDRLLQPRDTVSRHAVSRPASEDPRFKAVIDLCEQGHYFAKLPNHPLRDDRPRCPNCMAEGLDRFLAEDRRRMRKDLSEALKDDSGEDQS